MTLECSKIIHAAEMAVTSEVVDLGEANSSLTFLNYKRHLEIICTLNLIHRLTFLLFFYLLPLKVYL